MSVNETILAWHFPNKNLRLGYGDNRPIIAGETLSVGPPIEPCRMGLHASIRAIDALSYAPSSIVTRVELSGKIIHCEDKLVATHRKTLWIAYATKVLRRFAKEQALSVIHLWNCPNIVRKYLESDSEELREVACNCALAVSGDAREAAIDATMKCAHYAALSASYKACLAIKQESQCHSSLGAANARLEELLLTLEPK